MARDSIGARLAAALERLNPPASPADIAKAAGTTEATISNWIHDKVQPDHVKAVQLFRIADAVRLNPRELLLGQAAAGIAETAALYASHPVQHELLKVALQQVSEVVDSNRLPMSPDKRADLTLSVYDLLAEGMPEAKVLRFVRAAAA